MHKYGIAARRKRKKYVYPGKASEVAPNLLRELTEGRDLEIVFSDILEVKLADGTRVRGCFALWKRTRHILGLAFEYHMRAELVAQALQTVSFDVPDAIFHSDQGKQFGAQPIRAHYFTRNRTHKSDFPPFSFFIEEILNLIPRCFQRGFWQWKGSHFHRWMGTISREVGLFGWQPACVTGSTSCASEQVGNIWGSGGRAHGRLSFSERNLVG